MQLNKLIKVLRGIAPLTPLGMTVRGAILLLLIYENEGERINVYNEQLHIIEDPQQKKGATSGYLNSFEKGGLITKVVDDTDPRGQARKIILTDNTRESLKKILKG
jgi:DNA-binding MarR family transcriptional regulator